MCWSVDVVLLCSGFVALLCCRGVAGGLLRLGCCVAVLLHRCCDVVCWCGRVVLPRRNIAELLRR